MHASVCKAKKRILDSEHDSRLILGSWMKRFFYRGMPSNTHKRSFESKTWCVPRRLFCFQTDHLPAE